MRELIVDFWHVVAIGTKADNALLVQIEFHGSHLCDQDIDTHVPFDAADEQWLAYILLNDTLLFQLQLHHIINEGDAAPPRQISRFEDPGLLFGILPVETLDELVVFVWQHEGKWYEIVDFAENRLLLLNNPSQIVFRAQETSLREVD